MQEKYSGKYVEFLNNVFDTNLSRMILTAITKNIR